MMIQGLFRVYKKIILLLLVIMCAVIFWFFGYRKSDREVVDTSKWQKVQTDRLGTYYKFETEQLKGTLSFGTQGVVSEGKTLPVVVTAECKGKRFDGIVQINLPGEYGKGVAYQAALSCKKGVRSKQVLEVPQLGNVSGFLFRIEDQFEKILFSRTVMVEKTSENAKEISIGVLSSNTNSYSYLDKVLFEVEKTNCVSKLVKLSPDFSGDVGQLRALGVLLIDSFDTKNLNQWQVQAIKDWVDEGGILLLGGGSQSSKILASFGEEYGVRTKTVNQRRIRMQDAESDLGFLSVTYAELVFDNENSWSALAWTEPAAAYTKEIENGKVSVLTFSMAENSLIQWMSRDEAIRKLSSNLLKDFIQKRNGIERANWYLQKALYSFEDSQSPNIFYYGLFFLIYLFCLGIVAYDILKEMKRREYIWGVIPILSLIFTAIVGVRTISSGNSHTDSFFGGIQVEDREKKQNEFYLFYQSKDGKRQSLSLNTLYYNVEPMDYVYGENVSNQQSTPVDYIVNDARNGKEIEISETVPGVSQLMKITANEQAIESTQTGNFKVKIMGDDKKFRGTIENVSSRNYESVLLIRGMQYTVLSNIKSNSENKIMGSNVRLWDTEQVEESNEQTSQSSTLDNLLMYLEERYILEENKLNQLIVIGITQEDQAEIFADKNELKKYLSVEVNRYKILADQYQEKDRK